MAASMSLLLVLFIAILWNNHAFNIPETCEQSSINGTACCKALQDQCLFDNSETMFNCTYISSTAGNILDLTMRKCGLNGSIPDTITEFIYLERLDLSGNFITGTIPQDIGKIGYMFGIKYIDLSDNELSSSIPKSISEAGLELEYLDLSGNNLNRMNLPAITQLTNVVHLDLSDNNIAENLHLTLNEFQKVRYLNFGTNRIGGSIPTTIRDLTELETLNLERNDLSGTLPDEIAEIHNLKVLNISDNKFTGDIPDWNLGVGRLEHLNLGRNDFDCPVRDYSEWGVQSDFVEEYGKNGSENCYKPSSGGGGSSGLDGVEVAIIVIAVVIFFAIGVYCWHAQSQKNVKEQVKMLTDEDVFDD